MDKSFIQRLIEWIIHHGGLFFLMFVIFAETGLFVGFFLPGDSLLFAAGIFMNDLVKELFGANSSFESFGIFHIVIIIMIIVASAAGNAVGYWFGYKTGPLLYERRETLLFKRKHLMRAKLFYDKYGRATIFLAKFLPIIRTFAPIVAGMVKMKKPVFAFYNVFGSICWVSSMMLGGYFLDKWVWKKFHFSLKDNIEWIAIGIILVTTLPVLYKLFFGKNDIDEVKTPQ